MAGAAGCRLADRTGHVPKTDSRSVVVSRLRAPDLRPAPVNNSVTLPRSRHAEHPFHLIFLQTLRFVAASRSAKRITADDSSAGAALHYTMRPRSRLVPAALLEAALV
ncbi:predicted protein [Pyrenophora tritici-repentis Pt-1C-BFP]|uniref:Uncharacterized protein n=1 Tax=Pyrenophora tritici-repentis (strain Pt-1C-BFP) TaxID=426418 RepID=B2W750_PYRTR|nr:uncharacterized protein PTRG_05638 [Pyrenophora tritici-repentis Pt-1C-BFP]EDU48558.1 predicted protein [Pyrenophora tritici-repentis Pt-1C-BFP]